MPHTLSAKKRLRQNKKYRDANRARLSDLRTHIKKVRTAATVLQSVRAEGGDGAAELESLNELYRLTQKKLDRAGASSLIHRNKASRLKSRLQALIKRSKA